MRIFLLGFMAAGKSTLGRALGRARGCSCLDLDDLIEERAGMTVSDIFRTRGENTFRDLESGELARCARMADLVLATGGGVVEREANRVHLRRAFSVYLDWSWEALWTRLAQGGREKRPLANASETEVRARWERRDPLYREAAALTLRLSDADGNETPERLAARLADAIDDAGAAR